MLRKEIYMGVHLNKKIKTIGGKLLIKDGVILGSGTMIFVRETHSKLGPFMNVIQKVFPKSRPPVLGMVPSSTTNVTGSIPTYTERKAGYASFTSGKFIKSPVSFYTRDPFQHNAVMVVVCDNSDCAETACVSGICTAILNNKAFIIGNLTSKSWVQNPNISHVIMLNRNKNYSNQSFAQLIAMYAKPYPVGPEQFANFNVNLNATTYIHASTYNDPTLIKELTRLLKYANEVA